jgi:hypothetical protein
LSIYNIDCLSTGNCDIWAWVFSILSVIYMIFTTFIMILVSTTKKEVENDLKDKKT